MKTYKLKRLQPEQKTVSDVEITVEEKDSFGNILRQPYPLVHIVYHSPTGMNWGYGGSGPADTALSILADYLEEEVLEISFWAYKGLRIINDSIAWRYHQTFKFEFLCKDKAELTITGEQIRKFLEEQNA